MKQLKNNRAAGEDRILSQLYKYSGGKLVKIVYKLFEKTYQKIDLSGNTIKSGNFVRRKYYRQEVKLFGLNKQVCKRKS